MKTLTKISLVATLLSVGLQFYLTAHYYPLKLGFSSGPSVCSVNETFDCDAVAVSAYSSLFGIPVSAWGLVLNLVLFAMILVTWWGWTDHPERMRRWALVLAGVSATASVVMGVISLTQLKNYCLFCIALYILSFVIFECYRRTLEEPFFANIGPDPGKVWTESKGVLAAFVAIPIGALLTHQFFLEQNGAGELNRIVRTSIVDWKASPVQKFAVAPSLTMGPERDQAKMVIVEFADFLCGHCKTAAQSPHTFVKAHPDVRFEFFSFPLDGTCNEGITPSTGATCRLAEAVYCSGQLGDGWKLHKAVFDAQDELIGLRGSLEQTDEKIKTLASAEGIDSGKLFECIGKPETKEAIRQQAKQGAAANIRGTPAIFANDRLLSRGQLIPVLEAAREN